MSEKSVPAGAFSKESAPGAGAEQKTEPPHTIPLKEQEYVGVRVVPTFFIYLLEVKDTHNHHDASLVESQ